MVGCMHDTMLDVMLDPFKEWLQDNTVTEIMLNTPQLCWVEKQGIISSYNITELTDYYLQSLFRLIANFNKATLNLKQPLLSGSLLDGSRVQLVIPPISKYHTIAIRKQTLSSIRLQDLIATGFFANVADSKCVARLENSNGLLKNLYRSGKWVEFINLAIMSKKNIMISGGTSSGKTTFLNACLQAIPHNERIISVEDTREIQMPHQNQINLKTMQSNSATALISIQDLIQCCLRLRPDRIIVGEIRGKEIVDFLTACNTGHAGSITTIHASNLQMAKLRMLQMYKLNNVPAMTDQDIMREIDSVVDIIIQLERHNVRGREISSIYFNDKLSM